MNNFDFLKEPFLDWLKEKKKDIEEFQNFNLAQNAKEILDYNDIDIFSEALFFPNNSLAIV